ncbi:MAG TPA: hypothetical protein VNX65_02550 [Patescibacteria group bacterium]|jgi:hypothetical protein|nr:hypothetical protein [Patescibacteria group bacterium]
MAILQPPVSYADFGSHPDLSGPYGVACETAERIEYIARRTGYQNFIGKLNNSVGIDKKTGIRYAALAGEAPSEVSREEALVMVTPFSRTLEDTMVTAAYMQMLANEVGMTDQHGLNLPFYLFGSPMGEAGVNLSPTDRRQVAKGDMSPIARNNLELLRRLLPNVGRVALLGFSYGGAMVAATGCFAPNIDLIVSSMTIGAPGNAVQQPSSTLLRSFIKEREHTGPYKEDRQAVFQAAEPVRSGSETLRGVLGQSRTNFVILRSLAAGRLNADIIGAHEKVSGLITGVNYGTEDLITYGFNSSELVDQLPGSNLEVLPFEGERHGYGHSPHRLGTFVTRNLFIDATQRRKS